MPRSPREALALLERRKDVTPQAPREAAGATPARTGRQGERGPQT
jgi:hypothetical protein